MSYGAVSHILPEPAMPSKRRNALAMALLCAAALTMVAYHGSQKPVELAPANAAGLMEEGSIQLDPNSENPSADFYANSEAATGQDEDVEDAGPGGHLDGWTHPELLEPPNPEDLQSFVSEDAAAPVFNPSDYQYSQGAVQGVLSARNAIQNIQEELSHAHEEAEAAKDKYAEEEHKSAALKQEYAEYMQKMRQAQAMRAAMMQRGGMPMGGMPGMGGQQQARGQGVWATAEQVKAAQDAMAKYAAEHNAGAQEQEQGEGGEMESPAMTQQQQQAEEAAPMQGLRQLPRYQQPRFEERRQTLPQSQLREEMAIREANEEAALNGDLARLRIARRNLARSQRHPARSFRGAGVVENCPEGTPGCVSAVRSESEYRQRSPIADPQAEMVATAGDQMVPVQDARAQGPSGVVRDLLY